MPWHGTEPVLPHPSSDESPRGAGRSYFVIQAIQPIGLTQAWGCRSLCAIRLNLLCTLARCGSRVAGSIWPWVAGDFVEFSRMPSLSELIARTRDLRPIEPALRRWQAWPADLPFSDRVTFRWPSDDWPPEEPPIIVEDTPSDRPIEIVDWRHLGGLLDMVI